MNLLTDGLFEIGAASVAYVWRPLVIWTLVALPVYLILHGWRNASPRVQYHAHLALLLALPLSFALMPVVPAFAPSTVAVVGETLVPSVPPLEVPIAESMALPAPALESVPASEVATFDPAPGVAWTLTQGVGLLTVVALAVALVLLLRAVYLAFGLYRFAQTLQPITDDEALRNLQTIKKAAGVTKSIQLCVAPTASTPMTFGWRAPVIVVPSVLLADPQALRVTLAHEVIHIRRHDYAIGWVVRVVCACFAVHPLVWFLRRRIDQYREISCDAETLITEPVGTRHYAELLLRFSPLTDLAGPTPLRMVTLDSTLKRRIQAMKQFARFATPQALRLHRRSLVIAAGLLFTIASLTACTIRNTENGAIVVTPPDESAAELSFVEEERELREDESLRARQVLEVQLHELQAHAAQLEAHTQAREQELAHELQVYEQALREQEQEIVEQHRALEREFGAREVALLELKGSQEHRAREIRGLELKIEYLEREIRKVSDYMTHLKEKWEDASQSSRSAFEREMMLKQRRLELLQGMYMQHLEAMEQAKMEQYVRSQLEEVPVAQRVQETTERVQDRSLARLPFQALRMMGASFKQHSIWHDKKGDIVKFTFALSEESSVELNVYDAQGNRVETLLDEPRAAGNHVVSWNTDGLPKGQYLYRIKAANLEETNKVVIR